MGLGLFNKFVERKQVEYNMQNIKTFFRMYGQLQEILNKEERRKAITIAILSIFSAMLETLGVGIMLPFIMAMLQPEQLREYEKIAKILDTFNIQSPVEIVFFVGLGVVIVYIVKNVFILAFNKYRLVFRNELERDLSIKMLKAYINKPYSFYLSANSSEVMRGIGSDNSAVATVVDSYNNLINEGLTCVMIGVALVLINPIMALCIVALAGIIALGMVVVLRKRVSDASVKARDAFADKYKYSYESVNGIKEIDVMKRQNQFLSKFASAARKASDNNTKYLWIAMLPSRLTETIFVTGLVVIVVISYGFANNIAVVAAQLSALGMAAIRILPSISNIANSLNALIFQRPALESAYDNLVNGNVVNEPLDFTEKATVSERNAFRNSIVIKEISWKYAEKLPYVLEKLSMEIGKGESIGLIGESGAGKTTLADIILGLFKPQKGTIEVDGRSIFDEETQWHRMIGYVPQSVFLIDDTIRNNILFGIDEKDIDEDKMQLAIKQAQLSEFIEKQEKGLDTILGERGVKISGGQRQRIAIARALYYNPDILVLDEATSALDNETEAAVIEAINALQGEKTLIIVAHRLSTIENCDSVYEIKGGKANKVR